MVVLYLNKFYTSAVSSKNTRTRYSYSSSDFGHTRVYSRFFWTSSKITRVFSSIITPPLSVSRWGPHIFMSLIKLYLIGLKTPHKQRKKSSAAIQNNALIFPQQQFNVYEKTNFQIGRLF